MASAQEEVPCWSGMWFEIDGLGYMEVSDLDERTHRPPPGQAWMLTSISENVDNSSQIFRYAPMEVDALPAKRIDGARLMLAGGLVGCAAGGRLFLEALLRLRGMQA